MDRHAAALVLEEIASLLDARDDGRFRARAFRTAARAIEKADRPLHGMVAAGTLRDLSGVGPATAAVVEELVITGESSYHMQLRERAPAGARALLRVPGLGPKKVALLHEQLGISDIDSLEAAARSGRIAEVRGFGAATQQRILDGIGFARSLAGRRRYHQAEEAAVRLAAFIEALPDVKRAIVAGELRRGIEIVDRIVIVVVAARDHASVARTLRATQGVTWQAGNDDTVLGRFGDGLVVEVRLTAPPAAGTALLLATGSSDHLAALARAAADIGIALGTTEAESVAAATEEDVYDMLRMQYIPPELREGDDEVDLARRHSLPQLVAMKDLRGTFHCHTTYSDGTATVAEMAEGALELGWRYLGIADHSQNAGYAGGLSAQQVKRQQREIRAWNDRRGGELWLFSGVEADILQDGQLDYAGQGDAGVLSSLDYVIGSVHSLFRTERSAMTKRVMRAVSDPLLTMLGHATGRLLLTREGYDIDLGRVIDAAADAGAAIEINADPHRLDMSWQHWPAARARGVRTSINPDAHSVRGMRNVRYGVTIARKAWLTADDVINTWPLERVREHFEQRRAALQ